MKKCLGRCGSAILIALQLVAVPVVVVQLTGNLLIAPAAASQADVFTNSFLVRLKRGSDGLAQIVAKRNGFYNLGPVSTRSMYCQHLLFLPLVKNTKFSYKISFS